jgi:hypothetical protein
MKSITASATVFHIWLVRPNANWQPLGWDDLPTTAVAIATADSSIMTADEARAFLAGHNQAMLATFDRLWAIAVPVQIALMGDLNPGDVLRCAQMRLP